MEKANQKLKALLALWREKRGERDMPSRTDLSIASLRPWVGNLALIDLTEAIPFFRLFGTGLNARFGGEMTRRKLDTLDEVHGKTLRLCIDRVRKTRAPAETSHNVESFGRTTVFHELCLPLANDGINMDTLLFASFAEQQKISTAG